MSNASLQNIGYLEGTKMGWCLFEYYNRYKKIGAIMLRRAQENYLMNGLMMLSVIKERLGDH